MIFTNHQYDTLKWVVLILLPAVSVLLKGILDTFQLPHNEWVTLVNLVTVFLGSLIQLSSKHYHHVDDHNQHPPTGVAPVTP